MKNPMPAGRQEKSKGFTLIEMIVSMAVFMFIIGAAVGIFISIVHEQRKILAEQELINQTSYVIEYMSKALRMAQADGSGDCVQDDAGNEYGGGIYILTRPDYAGFYNGIRFLNASNVNASGDAICQEFFLDIDNTDSKNPKLVLKELKSTNSSRNTTKTDAVPLTSTKLEITSIKFGINGGTGSVGETDSQNPPKPTSYASRSDNLQPRITILLEAKITGDEDEDEPTRKIQTTVSQRNLNVK